LNTSPLTKLVLLW